MQKRTTLAAAAGLALALGAPLVASVPANAAATTTPSSVSASPTIPFYGPGVRSVDGERPDETTFDDGSPADFFGFDGHAATRTAELYNTSWAEQTAHVEQRLDGEGAWNEVASFHMEGQLDKAQFTFTVPEDAGYAEYRLSSTNDQGDRTAYRVFYVVEY
ncbi:hypothetical protein [Curtobacterium herbarum]|uniref:Uncharacterized protein n=1 Tax=Curtobacterium herbarum TaxID=150122 RepID=A0ABN1ZFA0_9MICO|nr:hypothetical protein [Curtobacterium herbarum]MBM7476735.1 hypothetical protein [Curtobacterium herbarum]MCS6546148.1 hypothetical protein [Curtobacterium herbarum]